MNADTVERIVRATGAIRACVGPALGSFYRCSRSGKSSSEHVEQVRADSVLTRRKGSAAG